MAIQNEIKFNYNEAIATYVDTNERLEILLSNTDVKIQLLPTNSSDFSVILTHLQQIPLDSDLTAFVQELGQGRAPDTTINAVDMFEPEHNTKIKAGVVWSREKINASAVQQTLPESWQELAPIFKDSYLLISTDYDVEPVEQLIYVLLCVDANAAPNQGLSSNQQQIVTIITEFYNRMQALITMKWRLNDDGKAVHVATSDVPLFNPRFFKGFYKRLIKQHIANGIYAFAVDFIRANTDFNWQTGLFNAQITDSDYEQVLQFGAPELIAQIPDLIELFQKYAQVRELDNPNDKIVIYQLLSTKRVQKLIAYAIAHPNVVDAADLFGSCLPDDVLCNAQTPNLHLTPEILTVY